MRTLHVSTANLPRVARGLFDGRVEDSLSLRLIVLAISWWVALSLGWVGTPVWIWVGAALLLAGGHAFSWYSRGSDSQVRPIIVGVAVVGALAMIPRTIGLASSGDWLPIAHFLLIFQAATSFELRTRGGLYVNIGISGAIFFLVTQQALDATFGIFLAGFIALLLSFFAMSFLVDQARHAEVRWFRSRLSSAWFWTTVVIACLTVSVAIFLLLPKQFSGPISDAQAVVLPLRASETVEMPEIDQDGGPLAAALPITPIGQKQEGELKGSTAEPVSEGTESSEVAGPDHSGAGPSSGRRDAQTESELMGTPAPNSSSINKNTASQVGDVIAAGAEDSFVMQVRSPVLTYWRGQVFDTFDGRSWRPDPAPWSLSRAGSAGTSRRAWELAGPRERPLYSQTYFIRQELPPNTVFAGYAPLETPFPKASEMATRWEEGSVYRTISRLPDFSAGSLKSAIYRSRVGDRYNLIPYSSSGLRSISKEITSGAYTDLERARRIMTYLDRNYEYDKGAADQLALTASTPEFLARRSAGTSMDFATATVLLARSASIPARLVTGYLPGRFDPLSGTYLVHTNDRHAWAEIHLGSLGWVPFDSAPRPATAAFKEERAFRFSSVNSLFNAGYGDDIYQSLRSSPQWINGLMGRLVGGGVALRIAAVLGVVPLVIGGLLAWRLVPRLRRRGQRVHYARLEGHARTDILRIYFGAEKLLRRAGLAARAPWQTVREFTAQAESGLGGAEGDLAWLRQAAWAAAYDPTPREPGLLAEARERLNRFKAALRVRRPPRPHIDF